MRFVFLSGAECGDVAECVAFGVTFPRGVPVQVDDPRAIAKLSGNRFFAQAAAGDADDVSPRVAPRRGRPPKVR